jgi:hypothetical protein
MGTNSRQGKTKMEHKLVLEVPEDVYELLTKTAEETGQPPEVMAAQWLVDLTRNLAEDPLEKYIGAFRSDIPDWAEEHDRYIGEAILERMHNSKPKDG